MFPTAAAVSATFTAHHQYHANLRGIAAESAANGEVAVSRQYAGRVAFELLQNALDRAQGRVLVRRDAGCLIVANDGDPVNCDPSFQLDRPISETNVPSDFHSLCSMHTSNKSPDKDNGNKGVGFRSVFSVASRVYVWSRLEDGSWWGILMLRDLNAVTWKAAGAEPAATAGSMNFLPTASAAPMEDGERRPSFHFPLALWSSVAPVEGAEWAHTIIVLPVEGAGADESVEQSIKSLRSSHLEFVGLRGRPAIEVQIGDDMVLSTSLSSHVGRWDVHAVEGQTPDPLFLAAHKAGLDLKFRVGGAVRWPQPGVASPGLVYCYLATEVRCPFGIDLHADLQTGIDRKHLELKEKEAVGAYNRSLLLRGIKIHMERIQASAGDRTDLWRMLDPGGDLHALREGDSPVRYFLAWAVAGDLFGEREWAPTKDPRSWAKWASLAARCFDGRTLPTSTYTEFWQATEHWINAAYPSHYVAAQEVGAACLAALRSAGARVIPITGDVAENTPGPITESIVPPAAGEAGTRSAEKLFHVTQAQREQFEALKVPVAVSDRGRRVTGWGFSTPFRKGDRLAGSVPFERTALLEELRQLPAKVGPENREDLHPTESIERQEELIAFAAEVFMLSVRDGQSTKAYADELWTPGWRADHDDRPSDRFLAGRAVATVHLPNRTGGWEPARQLRESDIDPGFTARLAGLSPDLDVQRFLRFLGLAVWPGGLRLVEGGDDGVVPARPLPPALCDAVSGQAIPPLSVPLGLEGDLLTLAPRLDEAWADGWLGHLAAQEEQRPTRFVACSDLGRHAWFPVGTSEGVAMPPRGMANPPARVAPRMLTLLAQQHQRAAEGLWRVRASDAARHWLRALGARTVDDRLEGDGWLALEVIQTLASVYPNVMKSVQDDPSLRFILLEIFTRALDTLVKKGGVLWPPDLRLLAEAPHAATGRAGLRWCLPGEVSVAAENPHREIVRRYAPDVALLVAPVGPKQAQGTPLENRTISVSSTIVAEDAVSDPTARGVHELLWSLLPRLLAVAELSRGYNRVVDPANVAERWDRMRLFRSADVWRSWSISGPEGVRLASERKGKFDDVMYEDERKAVDRSGPSRIFFDVDPTRVATGAHPPVNRFAEALAKILLDRGVEAEWHALLGEYDAGGHPRVAEHLERLGVGEDLVDAMLAGLAPLDATAVSEHLAVVRDVLGTFGLVITDSAWEANHTRTLLLGTHVGPAGAGPRDVTEGDVVDALASAPFQGEARRFVPKFSASDLHLAQWEEYAAPDLGLRLLRFAFDRRNPGEARPRDQDLLVGALGEELRSHVSGRAARLLFDPEATARSWLGAGLPTGPLDAWLPVLASFAPVVAAPAPANFTPLPASDPRPSTSTGTPPTKDEIDAEDAAKAAKGDGAETALLDWVLDQTRSQVAAHGEAAWNVLLAAMRPVGVARERMVAAHMDGGATLRDALWVSKTWRGSGFDILGLTAGPDGKPIPARYEVKALPEQPNVRLFISRNEVAVYRATRSPGTASRPDLRAGVWNLVGVRQNGEALILTEALAPVVDPATGGLGALKLAGFSPEDLQLVVRIKPTGTIDGVAHAGIGSP